MNKLLITLGVVFLHIVLNAQTPYYYYKNEKQYFSLNTKHAFLSLKEQQIPEDIAQRNITVSKLKSDKANEMLYKGKPGIRRFHAVLNFNDNLEDEQYLEMLSDIKNNNSDVIITPYYTINDSIRIGVSNFFYVKLKEEKDTVLLAQMAEQTGCYILLQDDYMTQWFILSITDASELCAMECANFFYESGHFQAAEPDFLMSNLAQCVNDSFFSQQWNLLNTGQQNGIAGIDIKACDAWQYVSSDIRPIVAVIDDGIKLNPPHPDLADNIYYKSYDVYSESTPSVLYGFHGGSCAGIIGAKQNNVIGISGVASNCRLMSISVNMSYTPGTPEEELLIRRFAKGIEFAWKNGAEIINNSWYAWYSSYITDAIDSAVSKGRKGLGCVIVQSAGNNGNWGVLFPADLPNVIAVGAVDRCGVRAGNDYFSPNTCDPWISHSSSYGPELSVVAPSKVLTTYDYNDGYWLFSGTSSSAPHVSGIAALILAINPNLTWQQVKNIIEKTAQKIRTDLYDYDIISGYPNGTWNEQLGYGLVDAHAAVLAARETRCHPDLPVVHGDITIFDGNPTWNTPVEAVGTITLLSGAELTITSEVKFQSNSYIIVQPGARLIVDGGKLTSACAGELWAGIVVNGKSNQGQEDYLQGVVELKNGAIIENAICGISAVPQKVPPGYSYSTGGIIQATDAIFRNNVCAIEYRPYQNYDINGNVCDNVGFFKRCTFVMDANNYLSANNKTFQHFVTLNGVKGIDFSGCEFINETNSGGKGIYAQDAGFRVVETCRIKPQYDCPCENRPIPSVFENLEYGIHSDNTGNPYEIVIDRSEFNNNIVSVEINVSNNYQLTRSCFNNIKGAGLKSESSSGYRIEENFFQGAKGKMGII